MHLHNKVNDAEYNIETAINLEQMAKIATRAARSRQGHRMASDACEKASKYYENLGNATNKNYNAKCSELDRQADFHFKNAQS